MRYLRTMSLEMKWMHWVFSLIILAVGIDAVGPKCLTCDDVLTPRSCTFVSQCSEHQLCSVQKKKRDTGRVYFSVGCSDPLSCTTSRSSKVECHRCCHGDYCNTDGCGEEGYPPRNQRGPVCFSCSQQTSPENCDRIARCSLGERCFVTRTDILFDHFYTSFCISPQNCQNNSADVQSTGSRFCGRCCTDDFCNTRCHGSAPPTVSVYSNSDIQRIVLGNELMLRCLGEGDPQPTLLWHVPNLAQAINVYTTQSKFDEVLLRIDKFQAYNIGNYTCVARNIHGTGSHTVPLLLSS